MEFSKQEYWSGVPFPSTGDIPDPGIEPESPALQADSLPSEPPGKSLGPATIFAEYLISLVGFVGGPAVRKLPASAGDPGSIPGSGRSPGGGNGTPLQYSCLENPMDGGA